MRQHFASAAVLLLLLGTWYAISVNSQISFILSDPIAVFNAFKKHTVNGELPKHALITGFEALSGFLIGVFCGSIIGFSFWYSPCFARLAKPYIFLLGVIPVFSFAPLIILWFGIGIGMKVALAALGTFIISLTQAYEGAQKVDKDQLRLMQIFQASKWQIMRFLVIPSSLVWVFNSMKLNVGCALLGAFIGEFISADCGIGYFMIRAGSLYDVPSVFAGGAYMGILALIIHKIITLLERK